MRDQPAMTDPQHPQDPAQDAVLRAYREAAAQDDARPSPQARAAVLAAAARAVHSGPRPVAEPRSRLTRYRVPLALAASLLVGTVAWQMAAQVDVQREIAHSSPAAPGGTVIADAGAPPARQAADAGPAASGASKAPRSPAAANAVDPPAAPPAPVAPVATAPTARSAATAPLSAPPSAAPSATPGAPATTPPTAASAARDVGTAASRAAAPAASSTDAARGESAARADVAAARQAAESTERRALTAPAPPAPPAAPMTAVPMPPSPPPPPPAASPAPPAAAPAPLRGAPRVEEQVRTQPVERRRFDEPRPLEAWLRQIAELRAAGRHAEADEELARLRRAYPDATVPPTLQSPAAR